MITKRAHRSANLDAATVARIRELALAGVEGTDIAEQLGLSAACVHKRISRMGLAWKGCEVRSAKIVAEKAPIGVELRRVRLAKGWRLCDFAKVLGVGDQVLWNAEHPKSKAALQVSAARIRKWLDAAQKLGRPPHALGTFDHSLSLAVHWRAVREELRQFGPEIRPKAWAKHRGCSMSLAYIYLSRMARRGLLRRESPGVYRVVESKARAA